MVPVYGMKVMRLTVGDLPNVRKQKVWSTVETRFVGRSQPRP